MSKKIETNSEPSWLDPRNDRNTPMNEHATREFAAALAVA